MQERCFGMAVTRSTGIILACTGIIFLVGAAQSLAIPIRPSFAAPPLAPRAPQNLMRITNPGEVYDLINTVSGNQTLNWPSPEIKRLAGANSWGAWRPKRGDVGEIIAICQHPSQRVRVFILKIGPYYAPMGEPGIEPVLP